MLFPAAKSTGEPKPPLPLFTAPLIALFIVVDGLPPPQELLKISAPAVCHAQLSELPIQVFEVTQIPEVLL